MPGTSKQQTQDNNNYLLFENTFKEYDNKFNLTRTEFKFIINTFFYILSRELIETGKVFALPRKLGTFSIRKFKPVSPLIDFQHFRKTGEKRVLRNNHSEQLAAQFLWDQSYFRFDDVLACSLKATTARSFSRSISKSIKENNSITTYYDK